jgi:hypothetical protein
MSRGMDAVRRRRGMELLLWAVLVALQRGLLLLLLVVVNSAEVRVRTAASRDRYTGQCTQFVEV